MLENIFLLLMLVLALITVQTSKIRRAIVYMGTFSLISSFVYIYYGAPDVAMAEAVIGSALATILFLVALKKYKVFTICVVHAEDKNFNDSYVGNSKIQILNDIEDFLAERELEPQAVYTTEKIDNILNAHNYDMVINQKGDSIIIYGNLENYQFEELENFLNSNRYNHLNLSIIRMRGYEDNDT
ncbi:MAG: putative multicomponent Na+:H+ antiporter subunit [Clostridiales bacterium]|uniref:MrpA C-terminal/MbhD domain-containing protein n=1 Tax=Mahella australiensis (strain DSM 15567 / CIP 107919 / 50-1 BON) TaxID=697281 RepID=F4A1E6_MAHA5|nr:DUF4040 domain-containing protein [Mahella australiensis]AEE97065.1 hypothetical protein Mahau_1889 [Mahella australiensis 50-1 BON]MDK2991714.1 putative multicomponent Na+:H+ antiporter subunit [Clostridiales bacterium]